MADRLATPEEVAAFHAQPAEDRPATPEEAAAFHAQGQMPLEPEEQKAFGDMRPDLTPESKVGKLALEASHGYLGNLLPAAEGLLAKVLPNPAGIGREDYANALNKSRADTGLLGGVAEAGGAILNPALRALGPAAAGAEMGGGEAVSQGGDLGDVVKSAGINAALGKGTASVLGGIASRFPELADRLAERITGQPAAAAAARLRGTIADHFPAGQYARDVIDYGLNKLTSRGTAEAARAAQVETKPVFDALRGEATIGANRALSEVYKGIAMAPEGTGAASVLNTFAKQLEAKKGAPMGWDELTKLNQYVKDAARNIEQSATKPLELDALTTTSKALDDLERAALPEGTADAFNAARKQFAVASQALTPSSKAAVAPLSAHGLIRRGALGVAGHVLGSAVGLPGLGTLAGVAAGGRPGAYAALKAYQAARTAPAQMLAKAAKVAVPGIQQAVARATASGQPEQAGAAIQKAQANDPDAR